MDKYEFIIRLDGDDRVLPNGIGILLDKAASHPDAAAIYGDWHIIDNYGRRISQVCSPEPDQNDGFHGACTLFRCSKLKNLNFVDLDIDCQDGYATYMHLKKQIQKY